ncbi:hypothetical protein LOZ03_005937 [Ophidiomyces ophidiicola]|nr:hypothetical protein LOZ03_005937 [Ophidiomyces ophidiicola]
MRYSVVSLFALSAAAVAQNSVSASPPASLSTPIFIPTDLASSLILTDTGSMTILPIPTVTPTPSGPSGPVGTAPGGTGSMPGTNSTMTRSTSSSSTSRTVSRPSGTSSSASGTSRPSSSAGLAPTNAPQAIGLGLGFGALIAAFL